MDEDTLPSYPVPVMEFAPFPATPKSLPRTKSAPQLVFSLTSLSRALNFDDDTDADAKSTAEEDSTSVVATPVTVSRKVSGSLVSTTETGPHAPSDNIGSAASTSEVPSRRVGEDSVIANPETVLREVGGGGSVVSTEAVEPCLRSSSACASPATETVLRPANESGHPVSSRETVPHRVSESGRTVPTREMVPQRASERGRAVLKTVPRQAAGAQSRPSQNGELVRDYLNRRRTLIQPVPLRALQKGTAAKKAASRTRTSLRDAFQSRVGTPSPLAVPRVDDSRSTVVSLPETATAIAEGDNRSAVSNAERASQCSDDGMVSATTPKRVSWQLNGSQATVPYSLLVTSNDDGTLESPTRQFDEGQSLANTPQHSTPSCKQLLKEELDEVCAKNMQYLDAMDRIRERECNEIRMNLLNQRVDEMQREVNRLKAEKKQLHDQFHVVITEARQKEEAKTELETKMSRLRELFDEESRCAICFSIVTRPMTLDCGHSFCRKCFLEWKACRINMRVCSCPMCRMVVRNFSPSRMLGKIVNGMKNVLMEKDRDTK